MVVTKILSVERAAFITLHACPLAAPGRGKSGGMNVYVRQLASALGELGMKIESSRGTFRCSQSCRDHRV
ncbi:MAG: hypothetical protein Ct9H300mP11_22220 [Chloroflexota bacterium]|nr:MAG: hypothetical protein Ct9H300mP11_22220 [Chloroflexota bacterium]